LKVEGGDLTNLNIIYIIHLEVGGLVVSRKKLQKVSEDQSLSEEDKAYERALQMPEVQNMLEVIKKHESSVKDRLATGGWSSLSAGEITVALALGLKGPDVH
jgi:hypothetical protein